MKKHNETALADQYGQLEAHKAVLEMLKQSPDSLHQVNVPMQEAMVENVQRTIDCIEQDLPFFANWYAYAPELSAALDVHWNSPSAPVEFRNLPHQADLLTPYLEETDRLGVSNDICSLQRLSINGVKKELTPIPWGCVYANTACDGIALLHEVIINHKTWRDVPVFYIDPPYWKDEGSIDYFAAVLKDMVSFIEKNSGKKMDLDRLREVIRESNKQYELFGEYNELRRALPTPHPSFTGNSVWYAVMNNPVTVASPKGTEFVKGLVDDAENRVRQKQGGVANEKIRIFWFDLMPNWSEELTDWLAEEWGANVVMDVFSYYPYTLIDDTSEESIYRDLGKRYLLDAPMVRQAHGTFDTSLSDIAKIVKDYSIDCVVGPGHMGHKDESAMLGVMRELCRELGVPFLYLEFDIYDPRYTHMEAVKDQFSQFFTAMGLG